MIKIIDVWHINQFKSFVEDIIINIHSIEMVILDALNEIDYKGWWNKELLETLLNFTEKNNIPVYFLSSNVIDLPIYNSNVKIVKWKTFYFYKNLYLWSKHLDLNNRKNLDIYNPILNPNKQFKYAFICLNNIVKHHRCLLMDLMCKHELLDKGLVSWRGADRGVEPYQFNYKYWTPKKIFIDQNPDEVMFLQETLPTEINDAFINLVTESEDSVTFFSEKTTIPLFFNQVFLVYSSQYFHRDLKELGFELYDELFDYEFDNEPDLTKRAELLLENIKKYSKLSEKELSQKYNIVIDKVKYNRELAFRYANTVPDEIDRLKRKLVEKNINYNGALNIVWNNKGNT